MIDIRCGKCGSRIITWSPHRIAGRLWITAFCCGKPHQFEVGVNLTVVLPAERDPPQSPER